jgi:hypothetical protein
MRARRWLSCGIKNTCLHYQCSEDIADETMTYKWLIELMGRMAESIVIHTPEYDRAKWGIDEPINTAVRIL